MKPILIAKVGTTVTRLLNRRGDFHDWIRAGLGREEHDTPVCEPHLGQALPEASSLSAVILTGSSAMITEEEAWSLETERWLAGALETGVPVLGICYGHQMLARIAGGRVEWNPRGREIGTVDVQLSSAASEDELFRGLPPRLQVQTTHSQSVVELPRSATLLASNEHDGHQSFSLGNCAWGVQFHPEFDADILCGYLEERRESVSAEGIDVDAKLAELHDSDHGRHLLSAFDALVRERWQA